MYLIYLIKKKYIYILSFNMYLFISSFTFDNSNSRTLTIPENPIDFIFLLLFLEPFQLLLSSWRVKFPLPRAPGGISILPRTILSKTFTQHFLFYDIRRADIGAAAGTKHFLSFHGAPSEFNKTLAWHTYTRSRDRNVEA